MAKQRRVQDLSDLGLVWSSDGGDHRRGRGAADDRGRETGDAGRGGAPGRLGEANPRHDGAASAPGAGSRVKVRRETAGRRGKTATTVSGVPLGEDGLRELAGRLKKRCGVGGSAKDGVIELQGDHRDVVVEVLRADGYDVVLAGG